MTAYTVRCACCRRDMANTYHTLLTARGINVHICTACGPCVTLRADGALEFPATCNAAQRPALTLLPGTWLDVDG